MIRIIQRQNYNSEKEYQQAYQKMIEAIEFHNKYHSNIVFPPKIKEQSDKEYHEMCKKYYYNNKVDVIFDDVDYSLDKLEDWEENDDNANSN